MRAVRKFLHFQKSKLFKEQVKEIKVFLGWPYNRVESSLSRINAIEKSGIDKKAVESIPTAKAATTFI